MELKKLEIQMLGNFCIKYNGQEISDQNNRSRKMWLLLAYLIYYRKRVIPQEELLQLLSNDNEENVNPVNALRTMFHRIRSLLNQLGEDAGHELIIRKDGNYAWNDEIPVFLDIDEFEYLCRQGATEENDQQKLEFYQKAINLYQGGFLSKLSSESWVTPTAVYYHNLYVDASESLLHLLEKEKKLEDAVALCRKILKAEPYSEELYWHLFQNLFDLGDRKSLISEYEHMNELFYTNFGVLPSEKIRALYYEAIQQETMQGVPLQATPLNVLQEQLAEPEDVGGALICNFDFFKIIYYAISRMAFRNGDAVHIGLLTISEKEGKHLSKRSLNIILDNLQEILKNNLRKGDIITPYGNSQYLILLSQSNYENSCMVCDRILKAYNKLYPHSPAQLKYSVQPISNSTTFATMT